MDKRTSRIAFAVTLALCLLFSMCSVAFAADETTKEDPLDDNRLVAYTSTSFVRDSSTKGTFTVIASSSNPSTPYMISEVTLQEAPLGSTKFVNSDVEPKTKTVSRSAITHVASFTITTKKEYRVKIRVTDSTNGSENTVTIYEDLQ